MSQTDLSEKKICDLIWTNKKRIFEEFQEYLDPFSIEREAKIAFDLRPDFLISGVQHRRLCFEIIEVKIVADVKSVAQLQGYISSQKSHIPHAHVSGFLIARKFHQNCLHLAQALDIPLFLFAFDEKNRPIIKEYFCPTQRYDDHYLEKIQQKYQGLSNG